MKNTILVTGMPRSGTTAVGDIISKGLSRDYIYEPFNYHSGLMSVRKYFEICGSDITDEEMYNRVKMIQGLSLDLKSGLFPNDKGLRGGMKYLIGGRTRVSYKKSKYNPFLTELIWKDPIVVFNTDWIADNTDVKCIVTIRNPYAVAASFKRMGWSFDLWEINESLKQSNKWYIKDEIPQELKNNSVCNSIYLYCMVYNNINVHSKNISVVKISDILQSPEKIYENLVENVDLEFTKSMKNAINIIYNNSSKKEVGFSQKAHQRERNLASVETYNKNLLSENERIMISSIITKYLNPEMYSYADF